jgi:elongation factor Tu
MLPTDISIVMPGDSLNLRIDLIQESPINVGLRFVIRESHTTIGAGIITDLIS